MELLLLMWNSRMESSRGGPLSTFIMMLPLIVVPAIAMLKPVGQEGGMLSNLLSAAAPEDSDHSADEIADAVFAEVPSDDTSAFEPNFGETASNDDDFARLDAQLFEEASNLSGGSNVPASAQQPPAMNFGNGLQAAPSGLPVEQLLLGLQQMGCTNAIWFDPGNGQFGFVAFFKAGDGIISYRFEAIAASRAAAVQDVIVQAQTWQRSSN